MPKKDQYAGMLKWVDKPELHARCESCNTPMWGIIKGSQSQARTKCTECVDKVDPTVVPTGEDGLH